MILFSERGLTLDKLLILLVGVSVLSTGAWNAQIQKSGTWGESSPDGIADKGISRALDEIKYHVRLAGYKLDNEVEPLTVKKGRKSDSIRVRYKDLTVEFFIDRDHNLIRRMGENEKTLAAEIFSLRTVKLSESSVVVTLTSIPPGEDGAGVIEAETMSKSYSVVIDIPWLM